MFWPFKKHTGLPVQTGQFQITAELPNRRGIGCHVSVLQGETLEDINRKIDLAQEVIERQRLRCEIPELEAKRDQMLKSVEQARDVLTELEEKQKAGQSLSSQEKMNIGNMRQNIKKMLDEIDKGTLAIAEAKRKAGVG